MKSKTPARSSRHSRTVTRGPGAESLAAHTRSALPPELPLRSRCRLREAVIARCPPWRTSRRLGSGPPPQWAHPLLCLPPLLGDPLPSPLSSPSSVEIYRWRIFIHHGPYYLVCVQTVVRYGAMGRALASTQGQLEAESRARLELEGQMGALNLQCEHMAARERRVLEEKRAAEETSVTDVRRYRESEAFPGDVRTYMSEHAEESYGMLKATRAGKSCVTMDCAHMHDLGDLPSELINPEPPTGPATSLGTSRTGVVTSGDLFLGLTLGLGGAVDTALDQIHIPPGIADFVQAADPEARDP
nr:DEAD-box ATP-dependent RNA helicase 38-like [Ipomoea trifida]